MTLLVLIYHRISETGGGKANVHCSSFRQFREQMDHIQRAGYPVRSWQRFEVEPAARNSLDLALTFDDGHRSDLECARLLQSLGYDALFFIATGYLGRDGYLDSGDVVELRRLGMKIGSHAHRHVQLTALSDTDVADELRKSREILEDIVQHTIDHVSFPGGSYDGRVLEIARQTGYKYFFTSDWGINGEAQFATRVFRRASVLNHLDTEQFDALLRQRHYYLRQLGFKTKELLKRGLGLDRYVQLRYVLLNLKKYRHEK